MYSTCSVAALAYDSIPPVQKIIEQNQYVEFPCLSGGNPADSNIPLEFRVDKTNLYTDLSQIYLQYSVKVTKQHETALTATDVVSTVNNFGYSAFSGLDVYINDRKISGEVGYYPYMAYLTMLLHTTSNEKEYYLRQAMWYRDDAGMMDQIGTDKAGARNKGFTDRQAYVQKSSTISLLIKVVPDFTLQQLIPDKTDLFFRFHRSDPKVCLLASKGDYKVQISQAKLYVPRVQLTQEALQYYSTMLSRSGFRYPSTRVTVRSKVVSKNDQNCDWIPISGTIPKRIYIFQTLNSAYNGTIEKNMFNFQTFDMRSIQVFRNGEGVPTGQAIDVDGDGASLLYTLSMDALNRTEAIAFNSWEYRYGYMVACFDLTEDRSAGMGNYWNPSMSGTVRIRIDYAKPLPDAITVFCMFEDTAVLNLDENRNPTWDQ